MSFPASDRPPVSSASSLRVATLPIPLPAGAIILPEPICIGSRTMFVSPI